MFITLPPPLYPMKRHQTIFFQFDNILWLYHMMITCRVLPSWFKWCYRKKSWRIHKSCIFRSISLAINGITWRRLWQYSDTSSDKEFFRNLRFTYEACSRRFSSRTCSEQKEKFPGTFRQRVNKAKLNFDGCLNPVEEAQIRWCCSGNTWNDTALVSPTHKGPFMRWNESLTN